MIPDQKVIGLAEHWKDADVPAPTDVTVVLARELLRVAAAPAVGELAGLIERLRKEAAGGRDELEKMPTLPDCLPDAGIFTMAMGSNST